MFKGSKAIALQANRVISLSGYRVDETPMSEKNKAGFDSFESESENLIKEFRSRLKSLITK